MSRMIKLAAVAAVLAASLPFAAFAEDSEPQNMAITAVYGGVITNSCKKKDTNYNINLKDTGSMAGLFAQYISPKLFQANVFLYGAPDVNYSKVLGIHANADVYAPFAGTTWLSLVEGVDVENINIDMKAGSHVSGYNEFNMRHNILFIMGRSGLKFSASPLDALNITILPYAGMTRETVDGKITYYTPYAPAAYQHGKINFTESENYISWGTNVTVTAFHFVSLTLKYLGRDTEQKYLNSYTAQLNVYINHSFGISLQSKYMDISGGSYDFYNIAGASYIF